MRPLLPLLGVLLLAFFFCGAEKRTDERKQVQKPPNEDGQVQAILAAESPESAQMGYRALFKSAKADDLRRLQWNASPTIAVQAAWQEVDNSVPEKEPERVVRPNGQKLSRFLAVLEARLRVKPPQWWAEAVLDTRANRRGNMYPGGINMAGLFGDLPPLKPIVAKPPSEATFDRQDGKPVIRVGSVSVPIPEDLRNKLEIVGLCERVSARITPSHCYVAMYSFGGYSYGLACVERSSAKTRWVSRVWGSYWGAWGGSADHPWVEITEQGNRVAVFGVSITGFHVEAFRMEDGVNVFRCSNSYSW